MGKHVHFSSQPRHVTPPINHLRKTSPILRVSTHIYGVSQEIDGKTFICRVNLGMWPLKLIVLRKMIPCSEGFNTHLRGFSGDRWENIHFSNQPRHVSPQVDHLGKTSPVLSVSTQIYEASKETDGKTCSLFHGNLVM